MFGPTTAKIRPYSRFSELPTPVCCMSQRQPCREKMAPTTADADAHNWRNPSSKQHQMWHLMTIEDSDYLDRPDMWTFCLLIGFLGEKAQILHTWKMQVHCDCPWFTLFSLFQKSSRNEFLDPILTYHVFTLIQFFGVHIFILSHTCLGIPWEYHCHVSHQKNPAVLFIKYWLFNCLIGILLMVY